MGIYLIVLILALLTFQNTQASELSYDPSLLEYYGSDHNEAEVAFTGYLVIEQATPPTRSQVDPSLSMQLRYMLGLMRSRLQSSAALYPKWTYTITEVKTLSAGVYRVGYNLKTKGIFASNQRQYTFTLPVNPKKIFIQAQGKCSAEASEEGAFWYHWEPATTGCLLKENVEYYNINTTITPTPNTIESFPEYAKLVDAEKIIKMTLFFGFEKYGFQQWSPSGGEDWGIRGFNQQRAFLTSLGYSENVWSREKIDALYKAKDRFIPYISEFVFVGATTNIRIRLVLADTGFNFNSTAFHSILRESLLKESVIVYNGHSGIGHNLDLAAIEKLRQFKFAFNPRYQILFLGSCVPYAYYTEMFFNRKRTATDLKGSLNLDILTYGKEAIFGNVEDQALTKALTKYVRTGEKQSYQTIIKSSPNYFFGVNGDEDNPKP